MLYLKCPTCKKLLGNIQLYYEDKLHKIMENAKLTDEEKNLEQQKLIRKDIGLTRECCIMRLLTYVDIVKIIK